MPIGEPPQLIAAQFEGNCTFAFVQLKHSIALGLILKQSSQKISTRYLHQPLFQ